MGDKRDGLARCLSFTDGTWTLRGYWSRMGPLRCAGLEEPLPVYEADAPEAERPRQGPPIPCSTNAFWTCFIHSPNEVLRATPPVPILTMAV